MSRSIAVGDDDQSLMTMFQVAFREEPFSLGRALGYEVHVAGSEHAQVVNVWLERVAGCSTVEVMRACEAAFAGLWQRTHLTLGEVTLLALVERVIHTAKEQYPFVGSVEITRSGLRCQTLQTQAGLRHHDVVEAVRFILTDFLTLLGNLTAEILTPALHAVLLKDFSAADCATEDAVP